VPQIIEVPGHGRVEFPDGMSDDQIVSAIKANAPQPVNPAAANPEANVGPFTIKGETDSGFNPAAALIKAGSTLDLMNKGALALRQMPGDMARLAAGMPRDPVMAAIDAEQQANAKPMRDLQEVHPGSTLLGDLATAVGVPWRALPAVAFAEYGTPQERLARAGAALVGGKIAQKGGEVASRAFAKSEMKAAEAQAQNAARDQITKEAQQAGLAVPPSQANPTALNRLAEGYAGKTSTGQALSIQNQPKIDALIKRDLNLPANKPVTVEALDGVSKKAYQEGYEPIKKQTGLVPDEQFTAERSALGGEDYAAMVAEVPEMANPQVSKLMAALDKPEFSGATAVNMVRKLRFDAKANFRNAQSPEALDAAKAQMSAADALEGLIDRNLSARGMTDAVTKFREARTKIAMAHDAERALNKATGSFAAKDYAAMLDKGKPLSGGSKAVAEFATQYPKAAQEVASSMPGISPLDFAAMGGISAATGMPALLAGVVGRPAMRSLITSPLYQKMMTQRQYKPSGILKGAKTLLDNEQAPWIAGLLGYGTSP
jgi:hypothetical protein